MRIEFANIINNKQTETKCFFWFGENIKTIEKVFNNSSIEFSVLYKDSFQRIYLLNKEAFIYVGIVTKYYDSGEYDISSNRGYGAIAGYIKNGDKIDTSEVLVCELNYNSFKGIHKSIFEKVSRESGHNWIGYPDIIRNYPYLSSHGRFVHCECLKHAAPLIKEYNIHDVINSFEGAPYCVAIYKINGENNEIGYATYCFERNEKEHEFAKKCIKDYLLYCLDFSKRPYKEGLVAPRPQGLFVDEKFKQIYSKRLIVDGIPIADNKEVLKYISYSLISINDNPIPNLNALEDYYVKHIGEPVVANYGNDFLSKKTLSNALTGAYLQNNYFLFTDGRTKWKSEFLVYQIVKKIYPTQTIYQYRPMFLKYEKGQLSYDIFITGLNIAIEYQGKQHFEAVDFFGGKEAFEDNKRRDEIKLDLSKKNGIKLIYITYLEDISEDLIKSKIYEALNF